MSNDYRDMPEWAALTAAVENFVAAKDKADNDNDDMLLQEFVVVACRVPIDSTKNEYTSMNYLYSSSKIGHHVTGLLHDALDFLGDR